MSFGKASRRAFLRAMGAGAGALASARWLPTARAADAEAIAPAQLSEHLYVYPGPINVGIVRDGDRALLIDCGDGRVADALKTLGVKSVAEVVFTHHHRDQACGASRLADAGAAIVVPASEKAWFDDVAKFWDSPKSRWEAYNFHPHRLMLGEPVRVDRTIEDGQEFAWGPAKIRAVATPGHTDGSLSYLVEVDGRRVGFCGDVICGDGQVWDVYSMQKGFRWPGGGIGDYHGFLGARGELVESLTRLRAAEPAVLVPSHGDVVLDPAKAIETLTARLAECHDAYAAISALRHYFPKAFAEYEGRTDHMAIRPGHAPPDCLRHCGTSWILVSKDGAALVMDCGSRKVIEQVQKWQKKGEIGSVEGLWVTHYHNDHTAGIGEFQKTFDCPTITDRSVAEVITNPMGWWLPCLTRGAVRVERATTHGESWQWHEFKLTAFFLPGQTLYHSGLLAEAGDLRMLFVGDSFTPGGIDDYCAQNRNWLGRSVGFDRCLELIEELRPTHIFNCHVDKAFDFTPEQCRFMRENLARREELFGRLFPWDHANYGMDASWVRAFPYEMEGKAGQPVEFDVVFTNHSKKTQAAECRAIAPGRWRCGPSAWSRGEIGSKEEGTLGVKLTIPPKVGPGRYIVPIDVRYGSRELPQFTEAVVVVG